ncbi:MAG: hypothetical protein KDD11_07560 [Acidobacteria bacterium]|nr:hypothetical protein [Acidobacteriota bacterium]
MAFKIFRFGFSTVVVILLLGVGLFLWSRSKSEPAAWQEQRERLAAKSESERAALADGAEERLRRLAHRRPAVARPAPETPAPALPRAETPPPEVTRPTPPSSPRNPPPPPLAQDGVTLTLDEVNALLEERSARWLAEARRSGKPLPLSDPVLAIEDDHLVLFAQLSTPGGDMLLGLPFEARVDERGGVARLMGVRLGQLPLPGVNALPRLLRAAGDRRLDRLAEKAEDATRGYAFDPVLELDGERLRITGLEVDEGTETLHLDVAEER